MNEFSSDRYGGDRSAEALAEFVNSEGGKIFWLYYIIIHKKEAHCCCSYNCCPVFRDKCQDCCRPFECCSSYFRKLWRDCTGWEKRCLGWVLCSLVSTKYNYHCTWNIYLFIDCFKECFTELNSQLCFILSRCGHCKNLAPVSAFLVHLILAWILKYYCNIPYFTCSQL